LLGITTTVNKINIPVHTYATLVDDLSVHCDGTRNRMTSTFDKKSFKIPKGQNIQTKDRVTRTPLKTGVNSCAPEG